MIKYYNILLIDNCIERSFLDKIKLNILKSMFVRSNINVIIDIFTNVDMNIKNYDLAIFNVDSKTEPKQYMEIENKLLQYNIPLIYLGQFNGNNIDNLNHREVFKKNILMNLGKVFTGKTACDELEEFLQDEEYILISYSSFNSMNKKEDEQWVREQIEIFVQMLLNRGHKIVITSLEGDEKQCNDFIKMFQDKNIKYIDCLNIYKLLELINKSKLIIDLGTSMSIIAAGLNKPFLSIGYDIDFLDLKALIDVEYMFLSVYELNTGKVLHNMEKIYDSYNDIQKVLESVNEKYFAEYIEFLNKVIKNVEPKEKQKSVEFKLR